MRLRFQHAPQDLVKLPLRCLPFRNHLAMPQPLSRVIPHAGGTIGNAGDYPLERNPNLLRLSMRVMTAWATLETFITSIFVAILGGNARLGGSQPPTPPATGGP